MYVANADPPETLSQAEERFKAFLAQHGYPAVIQWVAAKDVLIDSKGRFHVRPDPEATPQAQARYAIGLKNGLGVALVAISATDAVTFAAVFVPADGTDAQYRLMGRGLKCSAQAEKRPVIVVRNGLKWWVLRLQTRQQDTSWRDLFDLN